MYGKKDSSFVKKGLSRTEFRFKTFKLAFLENCKLGPKRALYWYLKNF